MEITFLETIESYLYDAFLTLSIAGIAACFVSYFLANGYSFVTLVTGFVLIGLIASVLRTIRFGKQSGYLADRVTMLERGAKNLRSNINHAIDSAKEGLAELGVQKEILEKVVVNI